MHVRVPHDQFLPHGFDRYGPRNLEFAIDGQVLMGIALLYPSYGFILVPKSFQDITGAPSSADLFDNSSFHKP